jgi:hypothetical protein
VDGAEGRYLVCVLGVDVVLDGLDALLGEVRRGDLHQVGNFGLSCA